MEKVYNDEWDSWEHPERRKRRKANAEANSSSDNRINSNNNNSRTIINQTSKDNKSETSRLIADVVNTLSILRATGNHLCFCLFPHRSSDGTAIKDEGGQTPAPP